MKGITSMELIESVCPWSVFTIEALVQSQLMILSSGMPAEYIVLESGLNFMLLTIPL